jgi:hypothetical protein
VNVGNHDVGWVVPNPGDINPPWVDNLNRGRLFNNDLFADNSFSDDALAHRLFDDSLFTNGGFGDFAWRWAFLGDSLGFGRLQDLVEIAAQADHGWPAGAPSPQKGQNDGYKRKVGFHGGYLHFPPKKSMPFWGV